jgi:hypothetical protein
MPAGIVVKVNNFGFNLTFTVVNADGTRRDLSGMTLTLYVYTQEQEPSMLFYGVCTLLTQSGLTLGQCTYAVLPTDLSQIGTFNAELEMTIPNLSPPPSLLFLEDTETFSFNIIPQHPPT